MTNCRKNERSLPRWQLNMFEDLYFNNIEKATISKTAPSLPYFSFSSAFNILINTYRTFERGGGFTNDDMVGAMVLIFIYEKKLLFNLYMFL